LVASVRLKKESASLIRLSNKKTRRGGFLITKPPRHAPDPPAAAGKRGIEMKEFKKILFPLDLSESSPKIVPYVQAVAE
jgi:hypothetical protein